MLLVLPFSSLCLSGTPYHLHHKGIHSSIRCYSLTV
nr:MAG TPA: hypothetical protein [Crassvirales sp.]